MAPAATTYQITTNAAELNKIDRLRECGVSQYIALPQLVVVGDQSSGKSSVLEALTKLPFPRNSQLCTTFPTQITFRNASVQNIAVSIIPALSAGNEKRARLREYKKDGLSNFTGDEFKEILKEVRTVMGIRDPEASEANIELPTFSGDILKIELSGPGLQNLSIIDTPGIFRRQVEGRTKSSDMNFVREMASAYIKDQRTIILAVLPAGEDEENWEILSMAQEADPEGIRTLGVLTKPDLIDPGTENRVMSFIRGEKSPLQLGYYALRNRGKLQNKTSPEERDEAEREFFAQDPWSSLDPTHVGVESLKTRLQELLIEITKRELPLVKGQINKRLQECRKILESMGADRTTTLQQQLYLHNKAAEFQKITDNALDAYYARKEIFTEIPGTRLPTLFINRSEKYASDMARKGHTISFKIQEDNDETPSVHDSEDEEDDEEGSVDTGDVISNCLYGQSKIKYSREMDGDEAMNSGTAVLNHHPELFGLFQDDWVIEKPEKRCILKWIEEEYRGARGSSLETISPAILSTLWQQQSRNWRGLTMEFLAEMIACVHGFICKIMERIFPEKRTRSSLMAILSDKLVKQYEIAIKQVEFITKVEKYGTPFTRDPIFQEDLHKFRLERLNVAMSSFAVKTPRVVGDTLVRLEDVVSSSPEHSIDNAVNGIYLYS